MGLTLQDLGRRPRCIMHARHGEGPDTEQVVHVKESVVFNFQYLFSSYVISSKMYYKICQ